MNQAVEKSEERILEVLGWSFLAALIVQLLVLFGLLSPHLFSQAKSADVAPPIEAEIFQSPIHEAHLKEIKPLVRRQAAPPEQTLSKSPNAGQAAPKSQSPAEEEHNDTQAAQPRITSHGPIAIASPAPKLPAYLRDQNLKTKVVIEFVVNVDGSSVPHLIVSSGNEELDALALKAAHEWRFTPAVERNQPIASKVRLRINFEVE